MISSACTSTNRSCMASCTIFILGNNDSSCKATSARIRTQVSFQWVDWSSNPKQFDESTKRHLAENVGSRGSFCLRPRLLLPSDACFVGTKTSRAKRSKLNRRGQSEHHLYSWRLLVVARPSAGGSKAACRDGTGNGVEEEVRPNSLRPIMVPHTDRLTGGATWMAEDCVRSGSLKACRNKNPLARQRRRQLCCRDDTAASRHIPSLRGCTECAHRNHARYPNRTRANRRLAIHNRLLWPNSDVWWLLHRET